MDLSPGDIVFNIVELSFEILKYCDVEASLTLLLCNKSLYSRIVNEVLWRIKVQREFGVIRFKPKHLTFFQQYNTMRGPLSWESAVKSGRCDQLRVIRRKVALSYYQITAMAVDYDQADVIRYVEEHEKYIKPSEYFPLEMKIGPKVAVYYAGKAFKQSDSCSYINQYRDILMTLFINRMLPENFHQLMMKDYNYNAASWYFNELRLISTVFKKEPRENML